MPVIQQLENISSGQEIIQMPVGSQNYTCFDFHNDSVFSCGISFGQSNGTGIEGCDFFMEPFTELLNVKPPASAKYTIGGAWNNGPIYLSFKLPGGGNIIQSNAPASEFTIVGYPIGVQVPIVVANNRMQNIGNGVNLVAGTATNVQDDARVAGNNTVEATVSGEAISSVTLTNNGILTMGTAAHPGQIIINNGFGNGQWEVDTLGNQTINSGSHLNCNAINAQSGNDFALNVNTGQRVRALVNSVVVLQVDGNGIELMSGKLGLLVGSIARISHFLGVPVSTTKTTVNPGLSVKPDVVLLTVNAGGAIGVNASVGYNPSTLSSTVCDIYAASSFNCDVTFIAFS